MLWPALLCVAAAVTHGAATLCCDPEVPASGSCTLGFDPDLSAHDAIAQLESSATNGHGCLLKPQAGGAGETICLKLENDDQVSNTTFELCSQAILVVGKVDKYVQVSSCTFQSSTGPNSGQGSRKKCGAAINLYHSSNKFVGLDASQCVFQSNDANSGSAIFFGTGAKGTVRESTFQTNFASKCDSSFCLNRGGAVFVYGMKNVVHFEESTFVANSAASSNVDWAGGHGGAIYFEDTFQTDETSSRSSLALLRCQFDGNVATSPTESQFGDHDRYETKTSHGGAVMFVSWYPDSSLTADACGFVGNNASMGGAVSASFGTFRACVFERNTAASAGQFRSQGGGLLLNNNWFLSVADMSPLLWGHSRQRDGEGEHKSSVVSGCRFEANRARWGGGLSDGQKDDCKTLANGGRHWATNTKFRCITSSMTSSIEVRDTIFRANRAYADTEYFGMSAWETTNYKNDRNRSALGGGMFLAMATYSSVINCTVESNTARGVIREESGTPDGYVMDDNFLEVEAQGGGIYYRPYRGCKCDRSSEQDGWSCLSSCYTSPPVIRHNISGCTFRHNSVGDDVPQNADSQPTGYRGGAIYFADTLYGEYNNNFPYRSGIWGPETFKWGPPKVFSTFSVDRSTFVANAAKHLMAPTDTSQLGDDPHGGAIYIMRAFGQGQDTDVPAVDPFTSTRISSCTITGGDTDDQSDALKGGGIAVCTRRSNGWDTPYDFGQMKPVMVSTLAIENCTFSQLRARMGGGAITLVDATADITGCRFTSNKALVTSQGGAISALTTNGNSPRRWGAERLLDCIFEHSEAWESGAVHLNKFDFEQVVNGVLVGNEPYRGPDSFDVADLQPLVKGCTFTSSTSKLKGGALTLTSSTARPVHRCFFAHNSGNSGGGIYLAASGKLYDVVISETSFLFNKASFAGGALYFPSEKVLKKLRLKSTYFLANEAVLGTVIFVGNFVEEGSSKEIALQKLDAGSTDLFRLTYYPAFTAVGAYNISWPSSGCAPGSFQTVDVSRWAPAGNFSSCPARCPAGRHNNPDGTGTTEQEQCLDCPAGTIGLHLDKSEPAICLACALGKYFAESGASNVLCLDCPSGFSSNATTGKSHCMECPVGRYAAPDVNPLSVIQCLGCGPGQYANESGATVCTECPFLTVASDLDQNAECAQECPRGFFITALSKTACSECPSGWYGHAAQATGGCTACPAHHFQRNGKNGRICRPCEGGKYQTNSGTTECKACPAGQFSTSNLDDPCGECGAGQFNPPGTQTCKMCPVGFASASGGVCTACEEGQYSAESGRDDCANCGVGQFAPTGTSICKACEPGQTQGFSGQGTCAKCAPGTYEAAFGSNATACASCPAGYVAEYEESRRCDECVVGQFSPVTGQSLCKSCPEGTFVLGGNATATCGECGAGQFNPPGTQTCESCPVGFASASGGVCTECEEGQYSAESGRDDCANCGVGRFAPTGKSDCQACEPGQTQGFSGQGTCAKCAPGTYEAASGSNTPACASCPAGYVAEYEESRRCDECVVGQFSPVTGQSLCKSCREGTFVLGGNATACSACGKGTFQGESGKGACATCPGDWFSSMTGQSLCKSCPEGTFVISGDDEARCGSCSAGTFRGAGECVDCAVGTISEGNGGDCFQCNEASFASNAGQSICTACKAHSSSTMARGSSCACDDGYYVRQADSSNGSAPLCTPCPMSDGASCKDNHLRTRAGWWQAPASLATKGVDIVERCLVSEACLGSNGTELATCHALHTGILCGSCLPGRGLARGPAGLCIDCLGVSPAWTGTIVLISVLVVVVTTFMATRRTDSKGKLQERAVSAMEEGSARHADSIGVAEALLPYVQRIAAMSVVFANLFRLPTFVRDTMAALQVMYLSVSRLLRLLGPCHFRSTFQQNLLHHMLLVPWLLSVAAAAAAASSFMHGVLKARRRAAAASSAAATTRRSGSPGVFDIHAAHLQITGILFFTMKCAHPGIANVIFTAFVCHDVAGQPYFGADLSLRCWTAPHFHIIVPALVGTAFLVVGLPVAMVAFVLHDRRRMAIRRQKDAAERAAEDRRQVKSLFSSQSNMVTRLAGVAHDTHLTHERAADIARHNAALHFTRNLKGPFWYWFAVDMLLSVLAIGGLGTVQAWPDVQVLLALVVAFVQVLLPAACRPFKDVNETRAAVIGGLSYFLMLLSGLAKLFAEKFSDAGVQSAQMREKLDAADTLISAAFVVTIVALASLVAHEACTSLRQSCAPCKGSGLLKVVPAQQQRRGEGSEGKEGKSPEPDGISELPVILRRVAPSLLARCDPSVQETYRSAWRACCAAQLHVSAVAIQALLRGVSSRLVSTSTGAPSRDSLTRSVVGLTSSADEAQRQEQRQQQQPPVPVMRNQSIRGQHRRLRHSRDEVTALLDAVHLLAGGPGQAAGEEEEARRKAMRIIKGFSHAELQGLHERRLLSDQDMVRIISASHEEEQASYRQQLEVQAQEASRDGRRRVAMRRLSRHGTATKLLALDRGAAFATADQDASGRIDASELADLLASVSGQRFRADEGKALLHTADVNGDGELEMEEFETLLESVQKRQARAAARKSGSWKKEVEEKEKEG